MERTTQLDTAATQLPPSLCRHSPTCPTADSPVRETARTVASHPEQGWNLLCNGVVVFEDTGELLPDGRAVAPRKPTPTPAVDRAAALWAADANVLIGGAARSGKTDVAAVHKVAVAPASPETDSQPL
ncbi:DUF5999 family protein [Streptomyces chartreusis]